jgi:glycosyltransferase involved in cell wall biosynthesis
MNHHPLVSIIISSYNYGRFLKDAIESAINQSYSNIEIIVVDDGSTDNSIEIIADYKDQITPIFKTNGGQASAFNKGFELSKGDIIYFLDSDDVLFSNAIQDSIGFFQNEGVAKVHWPLLKINKEGKLIDGIAPTLPLIEGNLLPELIISGPGGKGGYKHCPPTSGNIWSRNYLTNVFPIPEEVYKTCPDHYLLVHAPVFGEIRKIEKPLAYFRSHGDNASNKPIEDYTAHYYNYFEHSCISLQHFLKGKGIEVDATKWPRDSWLHQIYYTINEIKALVAENNSFILLDENHLSLSNEIAGRKIIPFVEKDGVYWGLPPTDFDAIEEIEKQKHNGATHIFIGWTTFWWLDHYKEMNNYLKSNYRCVLNNERLIAFDLRSENGS